MAGLQLKDFDVARIVLKDISLETPMGQSVFTKDWRPEFQVVLNLHHNHLPDGLWEVVLTATVTAQLDDAVAFMVEAHQAGVFDVAGADPARLDEILKMEAPRLIFPYLRESVDSVTARAGFPAPGLKIPDFEAWYQDRGNSGPAQFAADPA